MNANQLVLLLLFLMLGMAVAQPFSLVDTNLAVAQQYYSDFGKTNTETIAELKAKAENGDANAQVVIGCYYLTGQGVPLDYAESVNWFRKAAEQGNAVAQNNLGNCYQNGHGVTNDFAEAVNWYRKAAGQGIVVAQRNLGNMYLTGQGIETNCTEAAKWYRKAAEQGDIDAQINLGLLYFAGRGVMQDYAETIKWYRIAAEQGDAEAQAKLGLMYEDGKGVAQTYVEAAKWYKRGAQQGNFLAQLCLADLYAFGHGVPENNIEAYKWYNLASAFSASNDTERRSIESNDKMRDFIAEQMTPEEIAKGQQLSADFVPRIETPGSNSNSDSSVVTDSPVATGTGFFITDDGYLITNYHVVKDAVKVRLLTGAGLLDAMVVKVDAANDLALLKAVERFAPLPISSSRTVKLGGTVATVGFPDIGLQGFAPKLAKGEIASLAGAADDPRYFQISVPVQPGNSGGALVDAHGNVVGIVAAKLDASVALAASGALPENVNYAVKSSLLLSFLESVPDVSAKLKEPNSKEESFEEVVKSAQDAAVLVLVY